ncbi:caspase family protein [Winogradskyella sp. SYSU M77433]|uniref:caspase family protein n=1 Tax=Winogradskyella sp. SYSU M77433 TaxID=3042722 RepID=UPI0024809245|nr:caspase family protein [Winogradskyella sp. SYSU M77433]MDH7911258.1 caspase family protein [Winogradskyella sp. SYSU M77433]
MKHILLSFLLLSVCVGTAQDGERGSKASSVENTAEGKKRAIIIGVSNYKEEALKLNYADNDALLFKNYLSLAEKLPQENISLLINEDAVALNVVQQFKKLLSKIEDGDTTYIYFAGHGDVVDDFGEKEGFLLTADANANQEYYSGGVIPLALLNKIISSYTNKGSKVILILDACRSGFVFEEGTQKNMGTIQAMFENSTKILSCGSNELSYESGDLNHGYFTYYLVKGLTGNADSNTDNSIIYREIDDYLYDNVSATVSTKFKKNQTPVVRTKNDRAIYKTIEPNQPTIAFEVINSDIEKDKTLASRGVSTTDLKDKTAGSVIKKFNDAIERKSYHGKSSSAYEIYKSAKQTNQLSEGLAEKMESILLKKLSGDAQQLINNYIDGYKTLPSSKSFVEQAKNLDVCLELIGEDDYLSNRIKSSKLLLEAYAIIKSKNYSRYKLAKRKLNSALQLEPRAAYIHNALGVVYNQEKTYDSAHYHFNKAKSLIVSWSQPITNISDNFLDQYKYEDAKTNLSNSLGTNGINANLKLGEINEKEGKYNIAEDYYSKVLELDTNNTFALQKMSHLQKLKGNNKASLDWYKKAVKSDSINSIFGLGLVNYIQENKLSDEEGEKLLLNAIDYEPESSILYSEYADFLRLTQTKLTRLRLADSLYKKAIELNPYNTKAYAGSGWLQDKFKKLLKAKQAFEDGIAKNPENPESYFYYANFLKERANTVEDAKALYLSSIEKDHFFIPAYNELINLYNSENAQEKSLELLNRMINKHPETLDFYNLLGQTYFSKGEYNKAIEAYKTASDIDKTYTKGYKSLGYSSLKTDNIDAAKTYLITAAENDANEDTKKEISEFILTMARDKQKFGKPEQVKQLFELAFTIDNSAKTAIVYADFLYLNNEAIKSIEIALPAMSKENTKAENISLLEVMTKAAIDANAMDNVKYYYQNLINLDSTPDALLTSVYFRFIGDMNTSMTFRRRVDQNLLRSNKLKDQYSQNTIDKYILLD